MVLVDEVNMLRTTGERIRGGFDGFQSTFQVSQSSRESFLMPESEAVPQLRTS